MDVYLFQHRGDIEAFVQHIRKNPEDDNDVEIFVVHIRQGSDVVCVHFNEYEALHDFATTLMTEAASVRP